MTDKKPVHVVPHAEGWAVLREGNKNPSSVHPTREKAEKLGRSAAQRDKVEIFLHKEGAEEQ